MNDSWIFKWIKRNCKFMCTEICLWLVSYRKEKAYQINIIIYHSSFMSIWRIMYIIYVHVYVFYAWTSRFVQIFTLFFINLCFPGNILWRLTPWHCDCRCCIGWMIDCIPGTASPDTMQTEGYKCRSFKNRKALILVRHSAFLKFAYSTYIHIFKSCIHKSRSLGMWKKLSLKLDEYFIRYSLGYCTFKSVQSDSLKTKFNCLI